VNHAPDNHRSSWRGPLSGVVVGVLVSAMGFGVYSSKTKPHAEAPPPAFQIDKDSVKLAASAVPMRFETAVVISGPPLQRAPVTARVQTVEALTAPSFAPLDGRVVEVPVKIGDHVKEGDHLMMVASGDLATLV
jgi:cobalt-zinc-cadmium efflux system membrane fusion protein